jgi:hypothetical protein
MVTTPALLGDLIERLAIGRVDLDIVARLNDRRALAQRLRRLRPQIVVIGLHENETEAPIRALLTQLPGSKLIALSHDGRSIAGYELRLDRTPLTDLSPEGLIDFIAAAPAAPDP